MSTISLFLQLALALSHQNGLQNPLFSPQNW